MSNVSAHTVEVVCSGKGSLGELRDRWKMPYLSVLGKEFQPFGLDLFIFVRFSRSWIFSKS